VRGMAAWFNSTARRFCAMCQHMCAARRSTGTTVGRALEKATAYLIVVIVELTKRLHVTRCEITLEHSVPTGPTR
jgi:hypothetical protein